MKIHVSNVPQILVSLSYNLLHNSFWHFVVSLLTWKRVSFPQKVLLWFQSGLWSWVSDLQLAEPSTTSFLACAPLRQGHNSEHKPRLIKSCTMEAFSKTTKMPAANVGRCVRSLDHVKQQHSLISACCSLFTFVRRSALVILLLWLVVSLSLDVENKLRGSRQTQLCNLNYWSIQIWVKNVLNKPNK